MPQLIGTNPDQLPVCGMLGTLAFQDSAAVQITGGKIGGVDVSAIASAVLTGEETDTINSSANLVLRGGGVNLLKHSEEFDNAAWVKTRATVTANAAVAPDGTPTADKLVADATASATHFVSQTISATTGAVTFSIYAKADAYGRIQMQTVGGSAARGAGFDLFAGSVFSESLGATDQAAATITHVGNGWYRCSITSSGTGDTSVIVYLDSAGSVSFTGDGTSGLFIWGAQLVPGTSPGPYTKTTAQAITSAAPALIDAPNGMAEALPASVTPPRNGDMVIEATSNTTLTFKYRGSDGVVRSGTLTLA